MNSTLIAAGYKKVETPFGQIRHYEEYVKTLPDTNIMVKIRDNLEPDNQFEIDSMSLGTWLHLYGIYPPDISAQKHVEELEKLIIEGHQEVLEYRRKAKQGQGAPAYPNNLDRLLIVALRHLNGVIQMTTDPEWELMVPVSVVLD